MLKFLFWTLLLANLGLLAYEQGYFEAWIPDGREPGRMAHQFNTENIKLIAPTLIDGKTAGDAEPSATKPEAASCSEVGSFDVADAKRFDSAIQTLSLGDKLVRHETEDTAHNIVYIPSQGSKDGAEKKAAELRHLGVNDFFIIQDAGDLHWGISLGVFKTEEAARAQLASLSQKGVHSARLGNHNVTTRKTSYQLRDLDVTAKAGVDKILLDFPRAEKHGCSVDSPSDTKSDGKMDAKPDAKPATAQSKPKATPVLSREATH